MKDKGPDFLCIGAQASGTSWLYRQLKRHPDFKFPNRKEVHYFDRANRTRKPASAVDRVKDIFNTSDNWGDGLQLLLRTLKRKFRKFRHGAPSQYKKDGRLKKPKAIPESDSSYLSSFNTKRISGDVTPAYATLSDARVEQMARLLPHARIVFLMRHPVDRNWSTYRKKLKKSVFEEYTLLEMKHFFNQQGVVKRTSYTDTIDRYARYFGRENILIGFYDAIIDQPDKLLSDIVTFLGGDPDAELRSKQVTAVVNESPKMAIPAEIEAFLKEKYAAQVEECSRRYGSYADRWLADLQGSEERNEACTPTVKA